MNAPPAGAHTQGAPAGGSRRRRRASDAAHDNEERWLLTYADMITLLLVLFVVLFAMSSPSEPKFLAFRAGLTAALNPSAIANTGGNGVLQQTSLLSAQNDQQAISSERTSPPPTTVSMSQLQSALQKALARAHLQGDAVVTQTERGVVVQILADRVFFASGSAAIGPVGERIVDTVAHVVVGYPNDIEVDGYTDNQPITGGPISSNWELSADRAANVVDRLNAHDGIAADRLDAVGLGDMDPVATNKTPQGRMLNRRIDVVILGS